MYTMTNYCKEVFGEKLYKVAIDGGFTCPNRDGTLGTRGCIFCSAAGSGDFAGSRRLSVTEQIDDGIRRISSKMKSGGRYIAYFQAFTNTYAPVSVLEPLFLEAVRHPQVAVLSIATRPDCLGEDVLALIARLNAVKPVWVELGLQTIHEDTARYIRRGYPLSVYEQAMHDLKAIGVHVITHVILGLPGEDPGRMLETIDYLAAAENRTDGIKLQLLHILEGTDLAAAYKAGQIPTLSMEDYLALLADCVRHLPKDMVIHRLIGDGPKKSLLSPLWSADKKRVLNTMNRYFQEHQVVQGSCCGSDTARS
ncbi:MAG: TIGR01212 family radical SAM protein [Eubacteriales bacterium]|nr:TIGR01212 family radical SAM protein [Eubacteriales bacterium]